ncbi:type III-B CRISPR module RAMP protein Cmr4 [Chromatium okenii]|nr:type III-B CRISPR module RAMP protein Cmr4 [Chromatium okenii]
MQARLFHLHALSALHCGTGQSTGVVDLPIARARATQLPIVPGSSLRGVLRQSVSEHNESAARALFGPKSIADNAKSFAGALAVGDAHLLALPVRALAGIVCYVTAPFILSRYARDLERAGLTAPEPLSPAPANNTALVAADSVNRMENKLVLEDLDLDVSDNDIAKQWAEDIAQLIHPQDVMAQTDFRQRFAILPDNILGFLSETATELRTRISIDENTGTVKKGALWFEEHLPAETLLWGIYALTDSNEPDQPYARDALARALPASDTLLQIGGQAGVGRGLVRFLTQEGLA